MAEIPPKPPWLKDDPEGWDADVTSSPVPQVERDARGRFLPGSHGNPSGRPKSRYRATMLEGIESVIAVVKQAALAGDMHAAALLLGRTLPPLKPESDLDEFEFDSTASVVEQCRQAMQAAADGKITFERAKQFVELIGTVKDLGDVEAALDELRRLKRGKVKHDDNMPAGHVLMVDARELIDGRRPQ